MGDFVDTRLLGDVLGRGGLGQELIRLRLHIVFFRSSTALLCEEVSEINFDTGWGSWAQIIWLHLRFRFLEFEQLLFNHLDLLFLALHLDPLLFLLRRCHVGFQKIGIVSVSTEDTLVVHDV